MFAKWKQKRAEKEYARGFSWVFCAYFIELLTIEEIEAYTYGKNSMFDQGAHRAIRILYTCTRRNNG